MNIALKINWILTILLSISTGIFKLMQQEADVALFDKIGFNETATTLLGAVQLIGGLMLILPKTRLWGAYVMIPTFIVASAAVFANEMWGFAVVSVIFIVMTGLVVFMEKRNKA